MRKANFRNSIICCMARNKNNNFVVFVYAMHLDFCKRINIRCCYLSFLYPIKPKYVIKYTFSSIIKIRYQKTSKKMKIKFIENQYLISHLRFHNFLYIR